MTEVSRGILFPERLPRFVRLPPPDTATELIAWIWIPEWDLAPGEVSRQPVLSYPATNLVVDADGVTLWGPTTRVSERVLTGSGWAVGALLRPAATMALPIEPAATVDGHLPLDEPDLVADVTTAMRGGDAPDHPAAVARVTAWLTSRVPQVGDEGLLANSAVDLLLTDPHVMRVEDAATRLHLSARSLQRLTQRATGMAPSRIIRRRRLQEAAQRIREDPTAPLARIAADLGYADQAHLAADFRTVLGFTASEYRRSE